MAHRRLKPVPQLTTAQFEALFPTEDACRAYLQARRWPKGVRCPRCGNDRVFAVKSMPFKWQCYKCTPNQGYRFSVIAGTIFENTNKPLRDWFRVVHYMLSSKKGMPALQIQRMMGFGSYETALSMCHKIRAALIEPETKLGGIVEVDETYVGGKDKNRHWDKRRHAEGRDPLSGKTVVVGAIKRKGNVIARVVSNVKRATLEAFVREAVSSRVSLLVTDDFAPYRRLKHRFPHHVINHAEGQHVINDGVVGSIHTQTIEGFWSLVKRGIMGSFHKVSRKYLPLYVAEFEFRYNQRHTVDMFGAAIARC
jgi:transposase-like protein